MMSAQEIMNDFSRKIPFEDLCNVYISIQKHNIQTIDIWLPQRLQGNISDGEQLSMVCLNLKENNC